MGKRAKEHRKKVQKRNEMLKLEQKKLLKELNEQFQQQQQQRIAASALRQKSLKSTEPLPVYASTGDFVAKNYEEIFRKGGQDAAQKLIESAEDGPKFS